MRDMKLHPYEILDTGRPQGLPWNVSAVNAPSFWEHTQGAGMVVAVIDTGLDVNHPEFAGRVLNPLNLTRDGFGESDVTDKEGHGTHVSGIIAGSSVGIAPQCRIMPVKVFGNADGFQFQEAFRRILVHNQSCPDADRVVAVNCSWGGSYDPVVHSLIRDLVLSGVPVVCAAGNAGDGRADTSEIWTWPGFLWEVITTAALDQAGQPAGYSSSYDGIDLGAPGTGIYSAWPGGEYKTLSGTSMATPHVTAACALIAAAWQEREGSLPNGESVEQVLFKHLRPANQPSELIGQGVLDLTWSNVRWPLYRSQVGAYYYPVNADRTSDRLRQIGFTGAFVVKY